MSDRHKIVKVRKNEDGDITEVMLGDGNVFPINHAIMIAKHGAIEGVNVGRGKDGGEFLRTDSDDSVENNLSNLPTF
jgi:hypothetical protein